MKRQFKTILITAMAICMFGISGIQVEAGHPYPPDPNLTCNVTTYKQVHTSQITKYDRNCTSRTDGKACYIHYTVYSHNHFCTYCGQLVGNSTYACTYSHSLCKISVVECQ